MFPKKLRDILSDKEKRVTLVELDGFDGVRTVILMHAERLEVFRVHDPRGDAQYGEPLEFYGSQRKIQAIVHSIVGMGNKKLTEYREILY